MTVCRDVPCALLLSTASALGEKKPTPKHKIQRNQAQIYAVKLVRVSFSSISLGRCQVYPYAVPSKRWIC